MRQSTAHWMPDLRLIEAQAGSFESMSLADLGKARLMNRTDTKFLLPARQFHSGSHLQTRLRSTQT